MGKGVEEGEEGWGLGRGYGVGGWGGVKGSGELQGSVWWQICMERGSWSFIVFFFFFFSLVQNGWYRDVSLCFVIVNFSNSSYEDLRLRLTRLLGENERIVWWLHFYRMILTFRLLFFSLYFFPVLNSSFLSFHSTNPSPVMYVFVLCVSVCVCVCVCACVRACVMKWAYL